MCVYTNSPTWELIGNNTPTWKRIGTVMWALIDLRGNSIGTDRTGPDRQTDRRKSFQSIKGGGEEKNR